MEAIFRHFTVDSLKEINFANMVPIFFHLVVELISRRQSSNYENQKLGKLLIQCLDVGLLSFLISQGNMTDYCAEKSPQTKLLNSLIESSFHWTILIESSIIQNAASGCLMDLDICREKIYKIILCLYSPNIIVTILEMV